MEQLREDRVREYDRLAKILDRRLGLYARQTIEEALTMVHLKGDETILDACCGTGELLQHLALRGHTGRLYGVDFSDTILNIARRRLRNYTNITLEQRDVQTLPHPENSVDLIFNTNSLHYLDEPETSIKEFFRVLKPHGRFILVDLAANSSLTLLWAQLRRLYQPVYHKLYQFREARVLLERSGFHVLRSRLWRVNFLWSVMLFEGHKPAPHHISDKK